jgi:hypothetical protein
MEIAHLMVNFCVTTITTDQDVLCHAMATVKDTVTTMAIYHATKTITDLIALCFAPKEQLFVN